MKRCPVRPPLVCSLLVAIACGGERGGELPCSSEWCGTLIMASGGEPASLFPPEIGANVEAAANDFVFLPLAEIGPELNTVGDSGFAPRIARTWAFEDSLTIRFDLDPRARWHDGEPVTANDVVYTFSVYRDTLVGSGVRSRLDPIDSVTARDAGTAVFWFNRSYPEQFFDAVYHMRVLPHHLTASMPRARLGDDPFWRAPVGNGPYRLVRWAGGEFMEFAADSTFFLDRPGIPRLVWRFVTDLNTAIPQLLAGDVDFMNTVGPRENFRLLSEADHLRLIPYTSVVYTYVMLNTRDPQRPDRPHPLFGDRALRRAVVAAVDAQAAVRTIFGELGRVPPGPMTAVSSVWTEDAGAIAFDSALAANALDSLGWRDANGDGVRERDGRPLRFELLLPNTSSARHRAAVIVQEQLRRVGVAMEVTPLDFQTWSERSGAGRFDATFGAYGSDPSPVAIEEVWGRAGVESGDNWGHYTNPEVERWFTRAKTASHADTIAHAWREAVGLINADAQAIWIYTPMESMVIQRRFENVSIRPDQFGATIWQWRVTPGAWIPRDTIR